MGPKEPDIPLYANYPITRASLRRKLIRDATGRTGWKLFVGLLRAGERTQKLHRNGRMTTHGSCQLGTLIS